MAQWKDCTRIISPETMGKLRKSGRYDHICIGVVAPTQQSPLQHSGDEAAAQPQLNPWQPCHQRKVGALQGTTARGSGKQRHCSATAQPPSIRDSLELRHQPGGSSVHCRCRNGNPGMWLGFHCRLRRRYCDLRSMCTYPPAVAWRLPLRDWLLPPPH